MVDTQAEEKLVIEEQEKPKDTLWVVSYIHSGGMDINVCSTEEGAWRVACAIVLDYLVDLEDEEKELEILEQIENLYMRDAVRLYTEAKGDEEFEIREMPLLKPTEEQLKEVAKQWRGLHEEMQHEPEVP